VSILPPSLSFLVPFSCWLTILLLVLAVVDIFVTVLQNDGSAVEAGITCASLALADAGIEMYDMVAACAVGVTGSQTLVDYTDEEGKEATSRILVSAMGSLNEVTHVVVTGEIDGQVLTEVQSLSTFFRHLRVA